MKSGRPMTQGPEARMTRFLAPRSFGPGGLSQNLPVDFLERLRSGTLLASRVAGEM